MPTLTERAALRALLDLQGWDQVRWHTEATPPEATAASRAEWATILGGGRRTPSRPLPECNTLSWNRGGVVILDGD